VEAIEPAHVRLAGGEALAADLVIVAAGVRPETSLARAAGLEVGRAVVVDDALRASAPGVWAVGECAEHRGVVHGLWAPCAEQARAAGAGVVGDPAGFQGAVAATTLKVAGVDVFAGGLAAAAAGMDELTVSDTRRGTYRKLVLDGERLAGAVLVGDVAPARALSELLRTQGPVPEALLEPGAAVEAPPPSDADVVCSCNSVTRGALRAAIRAGGLTDVAQVANATRATTGCGGCAPDVAALCSSTRNTTETDGQPTAETMAA
jgi:ferredoxin-nitrate reductase